MARDLYLPPEVAKLARWAAERIPQKPGKKRLEMRRQAMRRQLEPLVEQEELEAKRRRDDENLDG